MAIYEAQLDRPRPSHLGGGTWRMRNLTDVTILFGRNGSGKSQLLRSLRDIDPAVTHYASPERGGEINYEAGLLASELDSTQRTTRRQANFQPSYRTEVMTRVSAYLQVLGRTRARAGKIEPDEFQMLMSQLLPNFRFEIPEHPPPGANNPFVLTRLLPNEEPISGISVLSSGESEVLTVGLDILTICGIWELEGRERKILLVDEPDTHLHPELQQHLGRFLVSMSERFAVQFFIATHSTTLLSALGIFGGDMTSVVYLNNDREDQPAQPFTAELKVLSTVLGGHALMGPLFDFPLLLVEGDDDYKIWSESVRRGVLQLAVIPCNGSEIGAHAEALDRVLDALREPGGPKTGYVLQDRDENPESGAMTHLTHIHGLKTACRESENLYLTDEVLAHLGLTWDAAQSKIQESASNYGAKEQRLIAISDADRLTSDLKGLMEELMQILDPKRVDWRLRVGQVVGANRPTGQLGVFLGDDVVDALWGQESHETTVAETATAEGA